MKPKNIPAKVLRLHDNKSIIFYVCCCSEMWKMEYETIIYPVSNEHIEN